MQNRHCRKKSKDIAQSDRHGADKFGDLITAVMLFSYDGLSEAGDVIGVVVCDAYTGWLACYPAAEHSTEEAHFALNTKREGRHFLQRLCTGAYGSGKHENGTLQKHQFLPLLYHPREQTYYHLNL